MKTKDIFCANCQIVTPHALAVDAAGEIIATCQATIDDVLCGRFIKFPDGTTEAELLAALVIHEEANIGQVKAEVVERRIAAAQAVIDAVVNNE